MNKIKIYFVERFSEGDNEAQINAMRKYFEFTNLKEAEAIYCGSIDKMYQAQGAHWDIAKRIPLITYCWDYYKWAHEGKHHAGAKIWNDYANFLKNANLVIVPSHAQYLRLKELLSIESKVVYSGIPFFDHDNVRNGGYILDPVRYYKNDPCWNWAEKAAEILDIPIIHTEHGRSQKEFRDLVAGSTFMTSCVNEASTGGLSLMEGLYLGKPSLVSDSKYSGAKEYLQAHGFYYEHENFDSLVEKMRALWSDPVNFKDTAKDYVKNGFSYDEMAKNLAITIKIFLEG